MCLSCGRRLLVTRSQWCPECRAKRSRVREAAWKRANARKDRATALARRQRTALVRKKRKDVWLDILRATKARGSVVPIWPRRQEAPEIRSRDEAALVSNLLEQDARCDEFVGELAS